MTATMSAAAGRRQRRDLVAVIAVAAVSVVAWLGWLGWHERKHRVPGTTNFEGPYEPWQVVALIVTLAVAVAVATWIGFAKVSAVTASASTTAMFSIDAATQPSPDADMWPAGAFLLLLGSLAGLAFVALVVGSLRRRRRP